MGREILLPCHRKTIRTRFQPNVMKFFQGRVKLKFDIKNMGREKYCRFYLLPIDLCNEEPLPFPDPFRFLMKRIPREEIWAIGFLFTQIFYPKFQFNLARKNYNVFDWKFAHIFVDGKARKILRFVGGKNIVFTSGLKWIYSLLTPMSKFRFSQRVVPGVPRVKLINSSYQKRYA